MAPTLRAGALLIALVALGACGGGGGGGGTVAPAPEAGLPPADEGQNQNLVSFSTVAPNETVVMTGDSVTVTATVSTTEEPITITAVGTASIETATVRFSYDGDRALRAIEVETPQASFSFDRNQGHELSCSGQGTCQAENATTVALAADPAVLGWNYQTFGVWAMETGPASFKHGAVSFGSPTSDGALPKLGTATFTGLAFGSFIDAGGELHGTAATMLADVNFGSRSIVFSTSNTRRGTTDDAGLDLAGEFRYEPGRNAFSGLLETRNRALNGQGVGRFYGPAAEEIGGVYSLSGAGLSRMIGGFGGRQ